MLGVGSGGWDAGWGRILRTREALGSCNTVSFWSKMVLAPGLAPSPWGMTWSLLDQSPQHQSRKAGPEPARSEGRMVP